MFKKDLTPGPKTKLKSSVQRTIRQKVLDTYPLLTPHIDTILPKKSQLDTIKLSLERVVVYVLASRPLFYQSTAGGGDGEPLIPHLALVHAYPDCFPVVRVDRGAIRFVLSGAALMAPGMTSKGGRLPAETKEEQGEGADGRYAKQSEMSEGQVVVVEAEGKEHACCVGVLKMGTEEVKKVKKGVAVDGGHYLGDGLWRLKVD